MPPVQLSTPAAKTPSRRRLRVPKLPCLGWVLTSKAPFVLRHTFQVRQHPRPAPQPIGHVLPQDSPQLGVCLFCFLSPFFTRPGQCPQSSQTRQRKCLSIPISLPARRAKQSTRLDTEHHARLLITHHRRATGAAIKDRAVAQFLQKLHL